MDITTLQKLGELGAVGIALFSLWINYKLVSNHENHYLKSHEQDTNVIKENTASNVELISTIQDLKKYLEERIK
jgi:hypothetical protein